MLALGEDLHPPLGPGREPTGVRKYVKGSTLEEPLDLTSPLIVEIDQADDDEGQGRDVAILSLPLPCSCEGGLLDRETIYRNKDSPNTPGKDFTCS